MWPHTKKTGAKQLLDGKKKEELVPTSWLAIREIEETPEGVKFEPPCTS